MTKLPFADAVKVLERENAELRGMLAAARVALSFYAMDMNAHKASNCSLREYPFGKQVEADIRAALDGVRS